MDTVSLQLSRIGDLNEGITEALSVKNRCFATLPRHVVPCA